MRFKKCQALIIKLTISAIVLCFGFTRSGFAQIQIPNASFEDTLATNHAPKEWIICAYTPDVFVYTPPIFPKPTNGLSYIALGT